MARDSKRFSFRGPFRGLSTSQLAGNDPALFVASSNMETYDGRAKPRNGYTRYAAGARLQPSSAIIYSTSPPRDPSRNYDDLILVEGTAPLMFWRRVFLNTAGTVDWARVSADTMNTSAGWTFSPTSVRKGSYTAGNRVYFYGEGDFIWVFERERIVSLARAGGGNEGAEATGTVETVVGATSTTVALDVVVGTGSQDNTYTFEQCEIEITGGTGVGQVRQIKAYDHTGGAMERLVTVEQTWTTNPDTTSTYKIYRIWFRKAGLEAPAITQFSATPTAGGGLVSGRTYSYKITFYDTHTGLESNGSNEITALASGGNLSINVRFVNDGAMPTTVYGNAGHAASHIELVADKIRYYRKDVTGGETDWTYISEAYIDLGITAAGSAFLDTGGVTPEASTVPVTHGVPPQGGFGAYHKGIAFISLDQGSAVYFSEPDDPIYGLAAEYFYQPPFLLQSVEPIKWMQSFGSELLIFQDRRVYRAETSGLPGDPFVAQITGMQGTSNGWTVAEGTGGTMGSTLLYYANSVGVFVYDGSTARRISDELGTLYTDTTFLMSDFYKVTGCYDPGFDRYLLTYSPAAAGPYGFFVYNARTQGWDVWTLYITGGASAATARSMIVAGTLTGRRVLFLGFENGRIGYWSNPTTALVNTDDGNTIPWSFTTIQLDCDGDPTTQKHIHEVAFSWRDGCGATCTIQATGNAASLTSASRVLSVHKYNAPLSIGADMKNIQMTLSGNVPASNNFWILGFAVTYGEAGQRG